MAGFTAANDRSDQLLFLRSALKTKSQTAEEFANNLETVNKLTNWMPDAAPLLTQEELKTACCTGSPRAWKTAFDQAARW
jgi:hypothetical protein